MPRARRMSSRRTRRASPAGRAARQSVAIALTCRPSDAKVVTAAERVRAHRRRRTPPAIHHAQRPRRIRALTVPRHRNRDSAAPDWRPAVPEARAPDPIAPTSPRIEIATAIATNLRAILHRATLPSRAATRSDDVRAAARRPYDFIIAIRSTSARCNG